MYPLLLCSLITWAIVFERFWIYRKFAHDLQSFHIEALNALLRKDLETLKSHCSKYSDVPTARLVQIALERLQSKDERLKKNWIQAMERERQKVNQDLRRYFWILGTIASAAPFIGLGGTVIGILRSFHQMAQTGSGGFTVVAAGISEALIATAAGIVVAVIAVIAFNAFQIKWSNLVLNIRIQTEEFVEILSTHES